MKKLVRYYFQQLKNVYHFINAACAVIAYRYPARHLTVIGVTGTDGKTTTTNLIYHILNRAGKKVALISTIGAKIGDQQIETGLHTTAPDPWLLQRIISTAVRHHACRYLVLETTSHGLDQHRVLGTNIKLALITNVTSEHLDYHPSFDHYLKSKVKIIAKANSVILNQDDPATEKVKRFLKPRHHLFTFSGKQRGTYIDAIAARFPHQTFNYENAMAAISVAKLLGVNDTIIKQAVTSFPSVPGRQQAIKNDQGLNVIVDFAHTPNALKRVLTSLKKTIGPHVHLIAVFGAAGLRDQTKRPIMGQIAATIADEVVLTSEDPRTENPQVIINQIKSGITQNHGHIHGIVDRQAAITFAITRLARKGDTVAVLGKGHEQSLNLDGRTEVPWSDVKACHRALEKIHL